jgi:SAM-dependent methyltransferase
MTCMRGIYCILLHLHMPAKNVFLRADEEAGGREAFEDAALYDFEYRRRRADINFYRRLAENRMQFAPVGPILDLACGTGRLLLPLLRDGHTVVGLDRSAAMLAAARRRVARLAPVRRWRCLLLRADLRSFACKPRFALAVAAFHSVQHLYATADLQRFLRATRACLVPGGWLAFDVLPPDPAWIGRDPLRRWGRTVFRHPVSGQRLVYTNNHQFDPRRQVLHMRLHYQPLDAHGCPSGPERVVRLCHRQLEPALVKNLLARTGFRLLACFGGFDGRPADGDLGMADEHVYVAAAR